MARKNLVQLTGTITKTTYKEDKNVCFVTIAFSNGNGGKTTFTSVSFFGKRAEEYSKLEKGKHVYIEGSLSNRSIVQPDGRKFNQTSLTGWSAKELSKEELSKERINSYTFSGNLTKDAVKLADKEICFISAAINNGKSANPTFVSSTFFGKKAAEYSELKKGDFVQIDGWIGNKGVKQEDGSTHYELILGGSDIKKIEFKKDTTKEVNTEEAVGENIPEENKSEKFDWLDL